MTDVSLHRRVAVITPYYREPLAMLAQCHESVMTQGVAADHFMVADGHPLDEIDTWDARHIKLPQAHDDNGSTPRGLGSLLAASEGYDFIAFLDADNWYHAGHLRSLLDVWEVDRAPVCTSFRTFHDLDGNELTISESDEDELKHIDTSCFMLDRSAFGDLIIWLQMPKVLSPISDRVFLAGLLSKGRVIRSTAKRTVAFRTQYTFHYVHAGMPVPPGAKGLDVLQPTLDYMASKEGITECVGRMGFWPPSFVDLL